MVAAQITDKSSRFFGGFRCESCGFAHGRADNAIYPLTYAYVLTGEEKYVECVKRLLIFRKKLTKLSGAVQNDFQSKWKGITAFSAINLFKTLLYFGDKLPADLKKKIEKCAVRSARWVHRHMTVGFSANINYYCAASLVNALYAEYRHDERYYLRAKELLGYCLGLFTENGLLSGEAKPHGGKSPKGCLPIDIGYMIEESMPCLVHTATVLKEEKARSYLIECAKKQLDFFLPDGGWDNSFGVRNNKWTYYGSRTSDGCIGMYSELSKEEDLFSGVAGRSYEVLRRCTHDGKLYGGMQYFENGQKACVHHTFCHACALADAIYAGIEEREAKDIPYEEKVGYKYYPEIDTYKIRVKDYIATVTGNDYLSYTYEKGAAHAGGGALSLLYKRGTGAVIAGSVHTYLRTEENNMQLPEGSVRHSTLLMRAEYEKEGVTYATCLDRTPDITVREDGEEITAVIRAKFTAESGRIGGETAVFIYRFRPEGVTITAKKVSGGTFVLPVIKNTCVVDTKNKFKKEDVFFLTGGFAADEYAFSMERDVVVTLR